MPIFRIMGGSGSGSNSNNNNNNPLRSTPNATTNFASNINVNNPTPPPPAARRASRHTYPGQRLNASAPTSSMPGVPPRVGGSLSSSVSSAASSVGTAPTAPPQASLQNTLVRGSAVSSSNNNNNSSTTTTTTDSNGNTIRRTTITTTTTTTPSAETNRAGAYAVTRTTAGPAQVYRVTVPAGVRPGSEFTVHAGPRRVRVRCPPTSRPGQSLQITLPPEPVTHNHLLKMAPLTTVEGSGGGGAVPMTPEVRKVNAAAAQSGGTAETYLVTIPPNIYAGMQFTVNVNGQRFMVTCPPNAGPNMKVRIVPPVQEEPMAAPKTQVFEVTVPAGVRPGQPFTLMANGQRVLVTCPPNVVPGQKIRFQLPVQQVVANIQLSYESENGGWCRTIRANDLKFQWVRVVHKNSKSSQQAQQHHEQQPQDEEEDDTMSRSSASTNNKFAAANVDIDGMESFDFSKAAYVRKINFLEGNDARMRTATLELVPAQEAVVDSRLVFQNRTLLSYADIATVQGKPLEEKTQWFQSICTQLTAPWDEGHVKIVIRRPALLSDSVDAVMSLGRDDMRKRWRIEFLGEPAIDAGGVTREWFQMITEQIFDPDFGLWQSSVNNQMCMQINPASGISCPDDHLVYFRFLGRVMGRALFDRQLIKGHMVRHLYKHLLGWPITFEDLEAQDEEYYQSLKKFTTMDDLSVMCLDFTVTEETMGVRQDVELIPGGNMKEVTKENLQQYLEANLRYRMLDRTKPQITELLLGFFDVIPEPALTVFDSNELELILCGLPSIDMEDWESNTIYSGALETRGKRDKVVEWFWKIVREDFDQEMRARLLQFVTGTSGVPTRGFSVLQGNDGNIKKFCIHGVDRKQYAYPRAHTCFNRIDLPNYSSRKELYERLKAAIAMSATGFDME